MIEVCFCVYQRPDRVKDILRDLNKQTNQQFIVSIWNNSGVRLDTTNFPQDRIRVFGGGANLGSQARFRLVPKTNGTPIIFFDDDQSLKPDFIEYHYQQYLRYGKKCILGWFNKVFTTENYWNAFYCGRSGVEVDYVGTCGMVMGRELFDREQSLQEIPEGFSKVEDLYLCYVAREKYQMKVIAIQKKCETIVDAKDQFTGLLDYKNIALSKMRSQGWQSVYKKWPFKNYRCMLIREALSGSFFELIRRV